MTASKPSPDAAFALLEGLASRGERCPERGCHGLTEKIVKELIRVGKIRVEIFARNWRRVVILWGPHAGKSTAPHPAGAKPWKIIDASGTRTTRGLVQSTGGRQPSAPRALTSEELFR